MLTDVLRPDSAETEGFVIVSHPLPAGEDLPAVRSVSSSPVGLHRVLEPTGDAITLPQTARRLDARAELWPDEVRISVETLNLDAASYRQLAEKHTTDGVVDGRALRDEVLDIIAVRGKMQNPVTGSGGMLIGTVDAVGPASPLGLTVGDRVATLVSLSLAAARRAGAGRLLGIVPVEAERTVLEATGLADEVVLADARSPLGLSGAVEAAGGPADITVVCVDVPGCEQPAILATAQGGTVIFFSMATSFAAAALGAEGLAADVRMVVGNGYVPGHADLALSLVRDVPAVRRLFESRLAAEQGAR